MREIVSFNHITLLIDQSLIESSPGLKESIDKKLTNFNFNYTIIPVPALANNILSSITDGTDAVYLMFLKVLESNELNNLLNGLIERKIPSFSSFGIRDIEKGVTIAEFPEDFFLQRIRRIALNIQRILIGDDPDEIPVSFMGSKRLTIN